MLKNVKVIKYQMSIANIKKKSQYQNVFDVNHDLSNVKHNESITMKKDYNLLCIKGNLK